MKTDDLIDALTADAGTVATPIEHTLWGAAAGGALVAALIFFFDLGLRPDIGDALESWRFLFKFVLTFVLLVSAAGLMWHIARPGEVPTSWLLALVTAPALALIGVIAELFLVPASEWTQRLVGSNARVCLLLIPLLSAAPLAALMLALRQGAPTHPTLAGATAGLLSASIGATLYATHCPDDSPLFLAVWYVIATVIVALAGAVLGARVLRW
jgi:hypothetical protein